MDYIGGYVRGAKGSFAIITGIAGDHGLGETGYGSTYVAHFSNKMMVLVVEYRGAHSD